MVLKPSINGAIVEYVIEMTVSNSMTGKVVAHPSDDKVDHLAYIFLGVESRILPRTFARMRPTICNKAPELKVSPCSTVLLY
jgi:hypothetical protein